MAVLLLPSWGIDMGRRWRGGHAQSIFCFVLVAPHSMWHLSFLTRHSTHAPALKVRVLNHWKVKFHNHSFVPLYFTLLISRSFPWPFPISPHHAFFFSFLLMLLYLFLGYQKAEQDKWDHYPCGRAYIYIYPGGQAGEADRPIITGGLSEHSTWLTQQ